MVLTVLLVSLSAMPRYCDLTDPRLPAKRLTSPEDLTTSVTHCTLFYNSDPGFRDFVYLALARIMVADFLYLFMVGVHGKKNVYELYHPSRSWTYEHDLKKGRTWLFSFSCLYGV